MFQSGVFVRLRLTLLTLLACVALSVSASPKTDSSPPSPPQPNDDPPAPAPKPAAIPSAQKAKADDLEDFQPLEGTPAAKEKAEAEARRLAEDQYKGKKQKPVKEEKAKPAPKDANVVDLTADQPGAPSLNKDENVALLDDMPPEGPLNSTARKCYDLLGGTRDKVESIRKDLAAGGKEITRLMHTSDDLSKDITSMADLWPFDKAFRDRCATAKRTTLVLNDELSNVPRQFSRVRWAFEDAVQQIYKLRLRARVLADSEPKPIAKPGKDGKLVYEDPLPAPADPNAARKQALLKEGDQARAAASRAANLKTQRENSIPYDLDGTRK